MKILLIIHGFPPKQSTGSEIYTWMLANQLSNKDDVTVLTRTNSLSEEEYAVSKMSRGNFDLITINNTLKYRRCYVDKFINHQITTIFKEILIELKPDVIHIGHLIGLSTTIVDEAKRHGIPIVYTLHDYWLICPNGRFIKDDSTICLEPSILGCQKCLRHQLLVNQGVNKLIRYTKKIIGTSKDTSRLHGYLEKVYKYYSNVLIRIRKNTSDREIIKRQKIMLNLFNFVDLFIAPSEFLLKKYVEFGLNEEKVIYLDYGFNTTPYKNLNRKVSVNLRIGYIGTLIPPKGIHVLLKAFSKIKAINVELRIHGGFDHNIDEYKSYSTAIKKFFKLDNVTWFGPYINDDIVNILNEIDIIVVPSVWYENSPLVIHEAFLAKIPVFASRVGGMEELVQHGINGFLFEPGNDDDLRLYIQKIINQPDLLEKFKSNIPKVVDIVGHARDVRKVYLESMKVNSLTA
jgi:glycosyltransferase involved in cell wall biosynthesis